MKERNGEELEAVSDIYDENNSKKEDIENIVTSRLSFSECIKMEWDVVKKEFYEILDEISAEAEGAFYKKTKSTIQAIILLQSENTDADAESNTDKT